jgi:hypothetical protein
VKDNPALPGGSLTSKPTWGNASRGSPTSAFFVLGGTGRSHAAGRMPMDNSASIMAQGPGESSRAIPVQLAPLGSGEEHVARLVDLRRFGLLRRWHDLLDEGVAAVFGITSGEAELVGLCFHAGKFTPARAATWLAERGFKPLRFVPNSGSLAAADFDAPLAAQVGRAVSGDSTKGQWRW